MNQRRRGLKKVKGKKLQLIDGQLQISDRANMDAQNFNFVPKSPNGVFLAPFFGIFERLFSDKKKVFRQTKI